PGSIPKVPMDPGNTPWQRVTQTRLLLNNIANSGGKRKANLTVWRGKKVPQSLSASKEANSLKTMF
ncbi:MAG TPA: hypothetical protein PLG66_11290, partial [Calditrichia bacterium]|nr:hypothetical protein [Calditrichia bacterium]